MPSRPPSPKAWTPKRWARPSHWPPINWSSAQPPPARTATPSVDTVPMRLARISVDGGHTWVHGNEQGILLMTKSTKYVLAPPPSPKAWTPKRWAVAFLCHCDGRTR